MRRGTILVLGLLMASTALPPSAEARPLLLKMLQGVTAPFGAILGAPRYSGRRAAHHRRATASRARSAARIAAPAAVAAGTTAAIASAGHAKSAPAGVPPAAETQAAAPTTTGSAPATNADTAVPLPNAAPPQRSAALSTPDEEQSRIPGQGRAPRAASHLGTVGPLAWPSAYEDVIGFTLWPKEYGERLRVHGIGDVLGTAFGPSGALAARVQPNMQQARADDTAPVAATCGSVDLIDTDWPMAQITGAIELTDAQRRPLDALKTALNDAVASIKSTCRDDANLAPVDRLRMMQATLWAVHDAAQLIRTPLADFYASLSEEQKQKFAAPAQPQAAGRNISRSDMARMCDLPASVEAPMRQLEQNLRPTKAQRASLDALVKRASEMGQFLLASCLKPMPATPTERLDAAADRLTAVIFATSNVNMALNDFTSQLSEEQKVRLSSMLR